MSDRSAILLYDGTCGFCARSVQFVLSREGQRRTLRFAPLESDVGIDIRIRHPELLDVDSVIWFEPAENGASESVRVRSAAGLRVLRYLGGIWGALGVLGGVVPRFVRDAVYDLIARHRHRLIRADASCLRPTHEQRSRFIG